MRVCYHASLSWEALPRIKSNAFWGSLYGAGVQGTLFATTAFPKAQKLVYAGAAIQNFLLKIEEAGLATCWIGHFVEEQVKDELKIPDDVTVEALFPIGYEFTKPRRKSKIDLDRILYFNSYQNKKMKNPVRGD